MRIVVITITKTQNPMKTERFERTNILMVTPSPLLYFTTHFHFLLNLQERKKITRRKKTCRQSIRNFYLQLHRFQNPVQSSKLFHIEILLGFSTFIFLHSIDCNTYIICTISKQKDKRFN